MKKLTIAICSYNRLSLLKNAIESLREQDAGSFELLVIDNASSDGTIEFLKNQSERLRFFVESNQGLSYARNRAIEECQTEYIGFIDDDAVSSENLITRSLSIIEEQKPDVFGGPIFPYYTSEKPEWFADELEIRVHQKKTGWTDVPRFSGSNMFFRKDVFDSVGTFNTKFGMSGGQVYYGEETELFHRIQNKGFSFYYDLDLIVKHHVPQRKMNLLYFMLANYNSGKSNQRIKQVKKFPEMLDVFFIIDSHFKEVNDLLFKANDKIESSYINKLVYDFTEIGQLTAYFIDQQGANFSKDEVSEIKSKTRKGQKLSFADYLRTLWFVTKKFIKSQVN